MCSINKTAIIVGGGHAAAQLALSLRQEDWQGSILVFSAESCLPYHRPPLSKHYLSDQNDSKNLSIRPPSLYQKLDIKFQLNTWVEGIDRKKKLIILSKGKTQPYDKLALCTGSYVCKLQIPGTNLPKVHYLRSLKDADAIKQDIVPNGQAVIIGGGYIGLETAACLRKLGMNVSVLEAMERVLQRVATEQISTFYTRVHEDEGVNIKTGIMATEIIGKDQAEAVLCDTGERIEADLIIIGVGVIPNTKLAANAALQIRDGIVVDEFARTQDSDIVAAGDCTNHPNPIYQRNVRLESVPNATEQAKVAAASLCGKEKPYASLPWFWSDQYDLKLKIAGLHHGFDDIRIRGDIENSTSFVVWYLQNGKIIAADCINRPLEFMLAKQIISGEQEIAIKVLEDDNIALKPLVANK